MQNSTKRASIFFGGFMIFVLLAGAFAPLIQSNTPVTAPQIEPTVGPTATFPAPIADLQTIRFDQGYLHPTGLYTIGQPTGWLVSEPIIEPNRAGITLVNNDTLSVVEASVEQADPVLTTYDEISARYNQEYLASSWSRYGDWTEASRREDDGKLVMDFNLTLNRQSYVARQVAWSDGEWLYSVRVVAPSNATDMLVYVLNSLITSIQPLKQFAGTPFNWLAHYDTAAHHIIRYPQEWTLEDTAPGRPTTITAPDGTTLRVESQPDTTIADEAAATAWVEAVRAGAEVVSVAPVEREGASGFSVAYTFTTVDGEPQSGLAVLLNGDDGVLHAANIRFPAANIDLNTLRDAAPVETTPEPGVAPQADYTQLVRVMDTFTILTPLNLAADVTATPTPLPTSAPVADVTAEATTAATDEADADATDAPEADATDAPDADDEATAEATDAS